MVLFALEPGAEVDIRATCGGLGRTLTGRDRRRLWRKVREWEMLHERGGHLHAVGEIRRDGGAKNRWRMARTRTP